MLCWNWGFSIFRLFIRLVSFDCLRFLKFRITLSLSFFLLNMISYLVRVNQKFYCQMNVKYLQNFSTCIQFSREILDVRYFQIPSVQQPSYHIISPMKVTTVFPENGASRYHHHPYRLFYLPSMPGSIRVLLSSPWNTIRSLVGVVQPTCVKPGSRRIKLGAMALKNSGVD